MRLSLWGVLCASLLLSWSAPLVAQEIKYTIRPPQDVPITRVSCDSGCCDLGCCDSCDQGPCCNSCGGGPSLYASLNLRGSFDRLESGGFNTLGPHPNTGSDNGDSFLIGGALGVAIPREFGTLRVECEGLSAGLFDTVTNSFRPPTPTFFYQTNYSDRWAVLGNAWYDVPLTDGLDFYAGGGLGGGGATMTVDDSVVQGRGSSTDFVWQTGCGLTWRFRPRITIDLGYRYFDWGRANVDLNSGGSPAGNFAADVTSHQLFLGTRYNSLRDLFSR